MGSGEVLTKLESSILTSGGRNGPLAGDSWIGRVLNQRFRRGNASTYEIHYATLPAEPTTPDGRNLLRPIVCPIFLLYVEGQSAAGGFRSITDVLPSEKTGIDGPCARTDHRERAAKSRENHCHRLIAGACQGDPHLHDRDERSRSGSP